jgi:RNA polymerase sigma-70 factor (ECF subfamily)
MDKDFFVQEIERVSQMLYRVSFAILQNNEDCKDALQQTALKAWEKRDNLRKPQYFSTWITRILINESRNIQRKKRGLVSLETVQEPAVYPPNPELSIIIQSMPEKLRLPLILQYAEGMNYEQIAKTLRLPVSTVRGRIYRAKQHLRKELEA